MSLSLKLLTSPSVEPVSVADVKLYTRVDSSAEDSLIASWITSARLQAEEFQRRSYITQEWQLNFDNFPSCSILFPRSPVQSVDSFDYFDANGTEYSLNLSNFDIDLDSDPARMCLGVNISYPSLTLRKLNGVKIVYTTGYGDDAVDVPDIVKEAIYLYCAYRYDNRTSEDQRTPKAFYDLLRPNRIHLC